MWCWRGDTTDMASNMALDDVSMVHRCMWEHALSTGAWRQGQNFGRRMYCRMRVKFSSYVDWQTIRPSWRRVCPKDNLGVKNLWRHVEWVLESWSTRADSYGDQLPRFWSQEAVEHDCMVGFIRWSLDLHKSDRERHGLLRLENLSTIVSHGNCMMLWSLDLKLSRGIVNLCYACMNLLYCVEMFVWCQERSLALISY